MDSIVHSQPALPARAWKALRTRGAEYAWHKALRRTLRRWPTWKRRLLYADPRRYWTLRGGEDYFREQEGQPARSARIEWIADQLARYEPGSILEVGCGYGKLLRELRRRLDVPMVGVDFSLTQLEQARRYLGPAGGIELLLGRGEQLPFPDGSFDMVVTSAVILHNPPPAAERIRREILRVARRFAAHNEETSRSYNRYGYDTAAWYSARGIELAESGPIPADPDRSSTQFCVAVVDQSPFSSDDAGGEGAYVGQALQPDWLDLSGWRA
jgi:SAM-dependent methyltransferase